MRPVFLQPTDRKQNPARRQKEIRQDCPSEDAEQMALIQWANVESHNTPELKYLYAIPNGGYRHPATAGRMKATGVKPGVPDLCLPVPRGGYHGLYIEMKKRKGGKVSEYQQEWLDYLNRADYLAVVCYGWDGARTLIEAYLRGHLNKLLMEQKKPTL